MNKENEMTDHYAQFMSMINGLPDHLRKSLNMETAEEDQAVKVTFVKPVASVNFYFKNGKLADVLVSPNREYHKLVCLRKHVDEPEFDAI
jgi:hypothetical protein